MVFPLSIRDTITALAPASAGGLLSITYTTIVVAYHAFTVPITGPHANSSGDPRPLPNDCLRWLPLHT